MGEVCGARVLVFGGRGFLGRHAVRQLEAAGHEVVVGPSHAELDLLTAGPAALRECVSSSGATAFVNAVGLVRGTDEQLLDGNATALAGLVDAVAAVLPGARLVHLGSLAEYGPGDGSLLHEDDVAAPITGYGVAKLAATKLLVGASAEGRVNGVSLRLANPVGAGQPAANLAGAVYAQLRADPTADLVVGNLDGTRDFVSGADVGRAIAAALAVGSDGIIGPAGANARVVNVGTGRAVPVRDLVEALRSALAHTGALIEENRAGSAASAQVVHPLVPDVRRAADLFGFTADDDLTAAVADVVAG